MKFHLVTVTAFLMTTFSAYADSLTTAEALEALINSKNDYTVINEDGVDKGESISLILSRALSKKILVEDGQSARLVNVDSSCKVVAPGETPISECSLSIGDGTYVKTKEGFKGPSTESGFTLKFKAYLTRGGTAYVVGDTVTKTSAG